MVGEERRATRARLHNFPPECSGDIFPEETFKAVRVDLAQSRHGFAPALYVLAPLGRLVLFGSPTPLVLLASIHNPSAHATLARVNPWECCPRAPLCSGVEIDVVPE